MPIEAITAAARTIAAGVAGIVTAYDEWPEPPPPWSNLPAVVIMADRFEIGRYTSREDWTHTFTGFLIIERGEDIKASRATLKPFAALYVAQFRLQSTLGLGANYYGHQVTEGLIEPIGYADSTYLGWTFTHTIKEKIPATFA